MRRMGTRDVETGTGDGAEIGFGVGCFKERKRFGTGDCVVDDGAGDGDGLVIRVHQSRHGGRRFRASVNGWTNQGDGYFGAHVRKVMGCINAEKRHDELRSKRRTWGDAEREERKAKFRECGAFLSLTWNPSVAQADEGGFSFLALPERSTVGFGGLRPRVKIAIAGAEQIG